MFLILLIRFITRIQRLLIPFCSSAQIFLYTGSEVVAIPDGKHGNGEFLIRSQLKEPESFVVILFHTLSDVIAETEIELCVGISLTDSKSEIPEHLFIILLYPGAVTIAASEIELCHGFPMFNSPVVVIQHFFQILHCSEALTIEIPDCCQRFRIILRGGKAIVVKCLFIILPYTVTKLIQNAQPILCGIKALIRRRQINIRRFLTILFHAHPFS